MGVESSSELPSFFLDITKWPKDRVEATLKSYAEGDYDFGIDYKVVMNITGYGEEAAKTLLKAHAKNDSGIINAVTLLISIISLGNAENRNEVGRLGAIFDLMDFSHNSQISLDELTILLLCVASSYSFILQKQLDDEDKKDVILIDLSHRIYNSIGKKPTACITRDELIKWTKEHYFSQGSTCINDILRIMYDVPAVNSETEEVDG